jgi:hypothetical protein
VRVLCLLLASALLGGCASQPPARRVALDTVCAPGIAALQLRQIAVPAPDAKKPTPFIDFADVGECLDDGGTRTAAALFGLSGVHTPARVALTIRADATATLATAATLLDAGHRPLRRYGFGDFARRGNTYTLDIFLNSSEDAPAAYLLLTPDKDWVGTVDESTRGAASTMVVPAGPVMFAYTSGHEAKTRRAMTDAGSLQIEIVPLSH